MAAAKKVAYLQGFVYNESGASVTTYVKSKTESENKQLFCEMLNQSNQEENLVHCRRQLLKDRLFLRGSMK
jgi:hypothetical protein